MTLSHITRALRALRTPTLARQCRRIAIERARLAELRTDAANLISAQAAHIAELEEAYRARLLRRYGTNSRVIAADADRQSKAELLA